MRLIDKYDRECAAVVALVGGGSSFDDAVAALVSHTQPWLPPMPPGLTASNLERIARLWKAPADAGNDGLYVCGVIGHGYHDDAHPCDGTTR